MSRPYQVNPENYEGKMRFWKQLIKTYCEYKGNAEFSINELKKAFKRKNVSPYCLPKVRFLFFKRKMTSFCV